MRFEGKVAVVTGGASGMGEATSKLLSADGAAVVVADVDVAGGERVVGEIIATGGRAVFQHADVADPVGPVAMVARALDEFGRLDLAANVAGVPQAPTSLAETTVELWDHCHAVNDRGLFLSVKAEVPAILAAGGGAIVNVSSLNGLRGFARMTAYGSSKFGAISTTLAVASEMAGSNVRINAVAPGAIDTPMLGALPAETLQEFSAALPMKRLGSPVEVAQVIAFLLSDHASYVCGTVIPIDGGWLNGG